MEMVDSHVKGLESCAEFFRSSSPPENLSAVTETCSQFIKKHATSKPIVLVTVSKE